MRHRCALLAASALLAACGPGSPQVLEGVTLLRYGHLGSGPALVMDGTVHFSDGCIYLVSVVGERWLLLWPPRSRLEDAGGDVQIVLDTRSIGDGDGISLAGDETGRAEDMAGSRVQACSSDRTWYVTGIVS